MSVVRAHEASDGSLHKSFADFAKHETALKVKKALAEAPLKLDAFAGDNDGAGVDDSTVQEFIIENADSLRNILNNVKVVQRGRGKKAS